jgi:hypothetical protein
LQFLQHIFYTVIEVELELNSNRTKISLNLLNEVL